jgi:hypothetical protein
VSRRAEVAILAGIVLLVVVQFLQGCQQQAANHRADRRIVRAQREGCDVGNWSRAYLLLRSREFVQTDQAVPSQTTIVAPWLFNVFDCEHVPRVPLDVGRREEFLRALARVDVTHRLPLVRDGRVVPGPVAVR